MADSILVDDLQRATGKTREECEKALAAANGDYDEAVVKLSSGPGPVVSGGMKTMSDFPESDMFNPIPGYK